MRRSANGYQVITLEIPEPTAADLDGLGMHMSGWVPVQPGIEAFDDWVMVRHVGSCLSALPGNDHGIKVACRFRWRCRTCRDKKGWAWSPRRVSRISVDLVGRRRRGVHPTVREPRRPCPVGISTMFEVPDSMSDDDAAAFMIPAHTAWHAVHRRGKVQPGETVVIMGAAGGLGAAIVQLCVAAGCDVLAVVGGSEKAAVVEGLGARAIDHSTGDVVETIRAATGGRGVDVIVDPVQGEVGARVRDLLVPDGRHVLCGHAGGLIAHDPHFYVRNHTLVGATLGGYGRDEMTRIHGETQDEIDALMAAGRYRPLVSRVVDFADVPAAITDLDPIAAREGRGQGSIRISHGIP